MHTEIEQGAASTATRRNFHALWAGTAVTNLADGVFKLTLPLVALSMTDSPALVAGASFANSLPWLLLSLPAGALADRVDRQRMMMATTGVRVGVITMMLALLAADLLPLSALYGAALVLGSCEVLSDTTRMSVIQMVVPRNRMESAFAKLTATETVANELAGPSIGGLLTAAGFTIALGASGLGYAAAVLALGVMTGSFRSLSRPSATGRTTLRADIKDGLRYVWRERTLRMLLLAAGGASACWAAWTAIIVVFAVSPGPLDLNESEFGLLMGALGLGGVLGATAAPTLGRWCGRRAVLIGAMVAFTLLLAVPAATDSAMLVAAATVVGGAGSGAWNVAYSSLRALVVPDDMMGRYSGVSRLTSWGSMPLGAAAAGGLAELAGVRAVFVAGGVVSVGVLVLTLRVVYGREFRAIEAIASAPEQPAESR